MEDNTRMIIVSTDSFIIKEAADTAPKWEVRIAILRNGHGHLENVIDHNHLRIATVLLLQIKK